MRLILILGYLALAVSAQAGTARTAEMIAQEHTKAMERWAMRLRTAINADAQRAVWAARPSEEEFGKKMWIEVGPSLREEWTLKFTPLVLEWAPLFATSERGGRMNRTPLEEIRRTTGQMHVKSPQVGWLCLTVTAFPDPGTLALVAKVEKENPDPKVQGQAAMAQALLLKHLGDDREVMVKRLTHLKTAIIKAADVKVGDTTVAKLVEDELYIISHLSKGRVAPEIVGRDAAGRAMSLNMMKGKVLVLTFWKEGMREAKHTVELMTKMQKDFKGKPVEVLGVSGDTLAVLRELEAKGIVSWRSYSDPEGKIAAQYRVRRQPWIFVIDQKGVIQFVGAPGAFADLTVEALLAPKGR